MRARILWTTVAVLAAALLGWWLLGRSQETGMGTGAGHEEPAGETPARDEPGAPEDAPLLRGTTDAVLVPPTAELEKAPGGEAGDAIVVTGRVVDGRRIPVAGVEVFADRPGHAASRARTDVAGRFELRLVRPTADNWEQVAILARRGEREVGTAGFGLTKGSPASHDVGTLALLAGTDLDVRVTDADGMPVPAEVLLVPWSLHGGGVWARVRTEADGSARLPAVPEGSYRAIAFASGHGRAIALSGIPRVDGKPLVLRLGAARDVDLRVVVAGTDEPVAGASSAVWEKLGGLGWISQGLYLPLREVASTDTEGRTRIEGLARDVEVFLVVSSEGYAPPLVQGFGQETHHVVEAGVREARIELPRPRAIAWLVTDADGPVPEDGAVVTLEPLPGAIRTTLPPTARMVDGRLEVDGVGPGYVHALATTPDDRMARLFAAADATEGNETSFRPARTIRVRVAYRDGEPASGLQVVARNQGNNQLHEPLPLDAEGRAVITGLWGRRADVYVLDGGHAWGGLMIGTVDLQAGDGTVEGTVARRRTGLLRVLVDGEPRLPPRYSCYVGGAVIDVSHEDPEHGEIHFRWRPFKPGTPGALRFFAPGYLLAGEPPALAGEGVEPDVSEVSLESGGTLIAQVRLPDDARVGLLLERWDPDAGAWETRQGVLSPDQGLDPDGRQRFGPLPAGRYRVLSHATGLVSEGADVRPGEPPVEIALDLSTLGYAQGRVEVPEGYDVQTVRIRAEGFPENAQESAAQGEGRVWQTGGFSVRIPGTTPITLRPVHPSLVPAAEGGAVTVTKPSEDLVLRMVEGDVATFTLEPAPVFPSYAREKEVAIRLYDGAVAGEPVVTLRVPFDGDGLRFGGFAPGTYTLWIDAPGYAPAIRRGVVLAKGRNDLGTIPLSLGSRVVIHILVPEGQSPPRVGVSARKRDAPSYMRFLSSRGEADVTLPGLGPGRFDLRVYGQMGLPAGTKGIDETIEVDGEETIERTLDLR